MPAFIAPPAGGWANGAGGIRVLVKMEELPVSHGIDGLVHIEQRDILRRARQLHTAVATALHDNEAGLFQL